MKTYQYTHPRAITLQSPSILKKSIFLLFSTLITYFAFADNVTRKQDFISSVMLSGEPTSNAEFALPLVLKSFKASFNKNKVTLDWVTGHEKDLSHFVVERSTNGVDYTEAGIVFASGKTGAVQKYSFRDEMNVHSKAVIYYRLKMMDSQRRHQYSPVRLMRIGDDAAAVQFQAYPNPVVNEVRITVPASWQNKQVNYELYNINGNLVKRISTDNASQTETLNVKELGTGAYVVKVSTQTETASQRIVKR